MDATLMERWIKEIYLKHTKCKKALLIMDTFRAHCTEKVINLLSKHHSSVALIPGGCTSKLQPLDVSLNKPFKQVCRQEFSAYLLPFAAVHHVQLSRSPQDSLETRSLPVVDQSTRPFVYTSRHDCESIQSHWTFPSIG